MNDLRAFLPAWQEMEIASPSFEEPVTQIEADVPIEPLVLQADATNVDLDLQVYERPLAVTLFGVPEGVPDWQDTHVIRSLLDHSRLGKWIRTELGVRTFQGLGKNSPAREQVVRRLTRDLHTMQIVESLPCESHLQVPLHRKCLPDCGPTTSHTRDIETIFVYRLLPRLCGPTVPCVDPPPSRLPSGGGKCLMKARVKMVKSKKNLLKRRQYVRLSFLHVMRHVSFTHVESPQLYLCDDWIQPMAVMSRPKELTARDKMRANLAKRFA